MARAASATVRGIFSWGAPRRRGLWRLWPGEEKHLQIAQLHQDGGHPAGKALLPIHQPPAAGETLHLSYVSFSYTNLLSLVWFGWQQPQQPQLLRNFMISRFNRSFLLNFGRPSFALFRIVLIKIYPKWYNICLTAHQTTPIIQKMSQKKNNPRRSQ